MLRFLFLSALLAWTANVPGALAQSGQPGLPADIAGKLNPAGAAARPQAVPAQPSAAGAGIVAVCKDAITAASAAQQTVLLARPAVIARWQSLVDMVDASAKQEEIFAKAASLGLTPADVDKLKGLKEPDKIKAHAVAEIAKLKPESIAAAFKKQVDDTCSAVLEGINADFKVAAAQARAEIETVICRQKADAMSVYLDNKYGEASQPASLSRPGPHQLAILSAQFGELSERLVCDAWPYIRKKCEDGRAGDKFTTGSSYCLIEREKPDVADFCGYDPSPRGENHLIVRYACGGREQRPVRVRGDTKNIRVMCRYPDPPVQGKISPEQMTQLKKFLTDPPCAVDKLD